MKPKLKSMRELGWFPDADPRLAVDSWGRRIFCQSCGQPLPRAKTKPKIICGERECEREYRREWRRRRIAKGMKA